MIVVRLLLVQMVFDSLHLELPVIWIFLLILPIGTTVRIGLKILLCVRRVLGVRLAMIAGCMKNL